MKVAGLSVVPSEAFKATGKYCRIYVFDLINKFWNDRADFDSWHKIQYVPVPNPGYLSYLNKC